MAAASSNINVNSHHQKKYDVFISFSGEIRDTFLSHLSSALRRKQINVFNDEDLQRGEKISPALFDIIKESHISVVIFSKSYPHSWWCLEELAQIHECYKTMNQKVLPVFYHVDPSHVQNLEGDFQNAIVQHKRRNSLEKVEIWSSALQELSIVAGFVSSTGKSESKSVDEIALDVSKKLNRLHSIDYQTDGFFGIDFHVQRVDRLLRIELTDEVRVIGIWGMGGIGKTTTADRVYHKIKNNFDAHLFVANVREKLEKRAPNNLRDEIIRVLLEEKGLYDIGTPHSIELFVRRRLQCKKVLIVYDDVNDSMKSKLLIGSTSGLYAPGSRIIVTSRDSQILKNVGAKEENIYQVKGLKESEALELFNWHAFHQNQPKEEFMELSKKAVLYAQGIPLALIVIGSYLYDKSIEIWKAKLEKLKSILDINIQKILRISYDELERDEKSMFLDIACFFKGSFEVDVKNMFDIFGFSPECAINSLCAKSLITRNCGYLTMHDLLEQMGKEIVRQESNNMLGEQSRLWNYEDIIHVLSKDLGTAKIEGIVLHPVSKGICKTVEPVEISSKGFMGMHKLRFLEISKDYLRTFLLPNGLEFLPESLRSFRWDQYPSSYLPSNFCPNNLVELYMRYSRLKELGNLDKSLQKLKRIDLSFSKYLIKIPNFSSAANLEVLALEGCPSLVEISWSVKARSKDSTRLDLREYKCLRRLLEIPCNITKLVLEGNAVIEQLPPNIGDVESLEILHLRRCPKLTSLPDSICDLKLLATLNLSNSAVEQLPLKIGCVESLRILNLEGCSKLTSLPDSICNLRSLSDLYVSDCAIEQLPLNIGHVESLVILNLSGCSKLTSLPDSICNLQALAELDVSNCAIQQLPQKIGHLESLENLDLSGCSKLASLPDSVCDLKSLTGLHVSNCAIQQLPLKIGYVRSLKNLDFRGCSNLTSLPDSICDRMPFLCLDVSHCTNLHRLPKNLGNLQSLKQLIAVDSGLKKLPVSINQLKQLEKLDCSGCEGLKLPPLNGLIDLEVIDLSNCNVPEFPNSLCSLMSLREIYLCGNDFKSIPPSIGQLSMLRKLKLNDSKRLDYIPELPSDVKVLDAANCTCLESVSTTALPDLLLLDGCINLKQETSSLIMEQNHLVGGTVQLFMPGSELPQKMMHKNNNGSSLSLTLEGHDLIGHSLCIVVAPNTSRKMRIEVLFEDWNGGRATECFKFDAGRQVLSQSENLFLWYSRKFFHHIPTSIQFNADYLDEDGKEKDKARILKCGYHPKFNEQKQHSIEMMELEQGSTSSGLDLFSFSENRKRKHQPDEEESNNCNLFLCINFN